MNSVKYAMIKLTFEFMYGIQMFLFFKNNALRDTYDVCFQYTVKPHISPWVCTIQRAFLMASYAGGLYTW